MTNIIRVLQLAWYETRELEIPLPDNWQIEICNMAGYNRPAMSRDQIKDCIVNPIGSAPIRELARDKNEVVVIFDDMTRVTRAADIVPFIMEELAAADIPDNKIRFICALGCHGAMNRLDFVKKLGEEIVAKFPIYNHNPFDNCIYVGITNRGTKISINAEVMKCDLKIAIGCITPHIMTGFGGGGKIMLPGVSSVETIESLHRLGIKVGQEHPDKAVVGMGIFDDNPMRFDIEEAATLAGLDVKIDCIVNSRGKTVAIFAGALIPAYAAGVQEAKAHYLTPRAEGKDIVIANTFAKANEAAIGLITAFPAVSSKGGDVVLICNAPEGQVTHYLMGSFGKTIGGNLRLQIGLPPYVNHLIVYTEYPDIAGGGYFEESDKVLLMNHWDDVLQVLQQFHGDNTKVAVYPNADIQYCV